MQSAGLLVSLPSAMLKRRSDVCWYSYLCWFLLKVLVCPWALWPACYVTIPALLSCPFCPHFSLSSGVLLQPHSGQAVFAGPHWCNFRLSQMMDNGGFVATLFAVMLRLSAVDQLEDGTWSMLNGPSLNDRKAPTEVKKNRFSLLRSNCLSVVLSHLSCSGISGITVPV